jgi:hypothetical protein
MFLSEPLQRQHGRRQVIGRMIVPTYRRAKQRTEKVHYQVHTVCTLPSAYCMHLVVYLSAQTDRTHVKGLNRFTKDTTKLRRLDSTASIHISVSFVEPSRRKRCHISCSSEG